jgi:uncharacterized YccA/Bax inhibitor family protein
MFRSSNPTLNDRFFKPAEIISKDAGAIRTTMTAAGVANKTFILLGLCVASAIFAWSLLLPASGVPKVSPILLVGGGAIGGLVLALITVFNPKVSPITAPLYALVEGLFVGAASAMYATNAGTIDESGVLAPNYSMVFQAVLLTFGILAVMLLAYRSGVIKVTNRYAMIITSAIGGIMLLYVASMVMSFFGASIPLIHSSGPFGIGFSLFVVAIASLSLAMDFEFIAQGERNNLPRYMEWYAGFALLVTLVWLYLEILRLLSKLQRR